MSEDTVYEGSLINFFIEEHKKILDLINSDTYDINNPIILKYIDGSSSHLGTMKESLQRQADDLERAIKFMNDNPPLAAEFLTTDMYD